MRYLTKFFSLIFTSFFIQNPTVINKAKKKIRSRYIHRNDLLKIFFKRKKIKENNEKKNFHASDIIFIT